MLLEGAAAVKAETYVCLPPYEIVPHELPSAPEDPLEAHAPAAGEVLLRIMAGAPPLPVASPPSSMLGLDVRARVPAALGGSCGIRFEPAQPRAAATECLEAPPGEEECEYDSEGLMDMMPDESDAATLEPPADSLGFVKPPAKRKCPKCSAFNPATHERCEQCEQQLELLPPQADGPGDVDKFIFGSEGNGSAGPASINGQCSMVHTLLGMPSTEPSRIALPHELLPGLCASADGAGWELAGGKGLAGSAGALNYAVADADLLTHMVPKTPPRKKCPACSELNPTARQSCIACGAKFQMKPKRSASCAADEEAAGGARLKRESAPAEGAPASSKLRAPRKKCSSCLAYNPTAQQACQACGARFTIKSKAKQQSKANKEQQSAGLGSLSLPLDLPLGLANPGGMRLPGALGSLGSSAELHAQTGGGGARSGPLVTVGADGRLHFHEAANGGAPLDLQAILNASSVLTSTGAPIASHELPGSHLDGLGSLGSAPHDDSAAPDMGGPLALPHSEPWDSFAAPAEGTDPRFAPFGCITSAQTAISSEPLSGMLN